MNNWWAATSVPVAQKRTMKLLSSPKKNIMNPNSSVRNVKLERLAMAKRQWAGTLVSLPAIGLGGVTLPSAERRADGGNSWSKLWLWGPYCASNPTLLWLSPKLLGPTPNVLGPQHLKKLVCSKFHRSSVLTNSSAEGQMKRLIWNCSELNYHILGYSKKGPWSPWKTKILGWSCGSVVECLPIMGEAWGVILRAT